MTRIKRWAIDNNLIPDVQFGSTADCIFILKTCIDVKIPDETMSIHLFCWFL